MRGEQIRCAICHARCRGDGHEGGDTPCGAHHERDGATRAEEIASHAVDTDRSINGRSYTTTLRLPADLARIARVAAGSRGQSVHAWVLAAIRAHALRQAAEGDRAVQAAIEEVPSR